MFCPDCHKVEAGSEHTWVAVCQLRQKVSHKRTFFWLEQLILKHGAHQQTLSIKEEAEGLDFYFVNQAHASRFVDFLQSVVPIRSANLSSPLLSSPLLPTKLIQRSPLFILAVTRQHGNWPTTMPTTMCFRTSTPFRLRFRPFAKMMWSAFPLRSPDNTATSLPYFSATRSPIYFISSIPLPSKVRQLKTPPPKDHSSLFSPPLVAFEVNSNTFWYAPFRALASKPNLIEFVVLDSEPLGHQTGKFVLADITIARNSDFGKNDRQFVTRTHLGALLSPGDTVLGYDMTTANVNDADLAGLRGGARSLPEIILVRKSYPTRRRKSKNRIWKLKALAKEQEDQRLTKAQANQQAYAQHQHQPSSSLYRT